ncbi:hypothetical protein A6A06_39585 [Streptomyces sp. CB02923]|nr:hypothetical protein A6A06_39585 [Streptomyces sp. CB02923]
MMWSEAIRRGLCWLACKPSRPRQVITGQDRRDFTAGEVVRAMTRLGFTCHPLPEAAPVSVLSPLQHASAMLGTPLPA